jgi:choline dehydrogenase
VRLRSNSPLDPPVISPDYLSAPEDVDVLVRGIELGYELMSSSLMEPFKGEEVVPGPNVKTSEQRRQYIRDTAVTVWHPSCTCRMGNDPMAVVDPQLRVRGVEGLRVVDCSIMPEIVNANLQATVIMIGEKAADMIHNEK